MKIIFNPRQLAVNAIETKISCNLKITKFVGQTSTGLIALANTNNTFIFIIEDQIHNKAKFKLLNTLEGSSSMIVTQQNRVILDNICYTFDGYCLTNPIKILIEDHTSVIALGEDLLIYGTHKHACLRIFQFIGNYYSKLYNTYLMIRGGCNKLFRVDMLKPVLFSEH